MSTNGTVEYVTYAELKKVDNLRWMFRLNAQPMSLKPKLS